MKIKTLVLPLLCLVSGAAIGSGAHTVNAQAAPDWKVFRASAGPASGDQMDYVPKAYGRVLSIQMMDPATGWLWLEGADGTLRLLQLTVRKGASPGNSVWTSVQEFPRR